jgi:hypothetical protein
MGIKENQIILSRGERQAKEFITESVAPHGTDVPGLPGLLYPYQQDWVTDDSRLKIAKRNP